MIKANMGRKIQHWHIVNVFLIIYDIVAVNLAHFLALWFRFDCRFTAITPRFLEAFVKYIPIHTAVCIACFVLFKFYLSIWRFAGFRELINVLFGSVISSIINGVGITLLFRRMPVTYYVFGAAIQFLLVIGIRFSYRLFLFERRRFYKKDSSANIHNALLVGAGSAGRTILQDLLNTKEFGVKVRCIIDDNPNKWGRYIDGIAVAGGREDIPSCVEKYAISKIYIAIPSASVKDKKDIIEICKETGCEIKILPALSKLTDENVSVRDLESVAIEDLLGREPIRVNSEEILAQLEGKVVLVTGGGGSIGSELCRQIAGQNPKQLIILDIYENGVYDIEYELRNKYPGLNSKVLIGSVRDGKRMDQLFRDYKPEVVYHAAAHKHVPLMEDSPCESIKNNTAGTYNLAYAAMVHGCRRFILISTDKAVNPANIMGASKRLCEMIIQSFDRMIREGRPGDIPMLGAYVQSGEACPGEPVPDNVCTEFVAVRFGNVLGSSGSVIPLFTKQIAEGGPVTVTHPDIIRYFMTIPEAVTLVLQAGAYAKGGEIFVFDMGEPVKIDTLARNLIKLSGHKPDVDIMIEYVGLRPGEKLYEEKLMDEEGLKTTANELIFIGKPVEFDPDAFLKDVRELMNLSYEGCSDIREHVQRVVTTYHPADNGNGTPEKDNI